MVIIYNHSRHLVSPLAHQLGFKAPIVSVAEHVQYLLRALRVEVLRVQQEAVHVKQHATNASHYDGK